MVEGSALLRRGTGNCSVSSNLTVSAIFIICSTMHLRFEVNCDEKNLGISMPTVLREAGFRFLFYSREGIEPPHIHVIGHGGEMKV